MKKRILAALICLCMALSLLPVQTQAEELTLPGLFAGKFKAGSQIFDCQRRANVTGPGIWAAYSFKVPFAGYFPSRIQFLPTDLDDKYFVFKYLDSRDIADAANVKRPLVGLYLYNISDNTPAYIAGKTRADGYVNDGYVEVVADEGILYISNQGDFGYVISNAAGYAYGSFTSADPLYLREKRILDPTLQDLFEYDATDIPLEANELLLRFYPNGTNVTNMPTPNYRIKTVGVDFKIEVEDPTRSGYTFTGWNGQADGRGVTYLANAVYTSNVGIKLYAQWVLNAGGMQDQDAPAGVGTVNATVRGGSGSLTGTTSAMQYRTAEDANTWHWCTDGATTVPVGEYWVRYAAKDGYNASPAVYAGKVLEPAATPLATDFTIQNVSAYGKSDASIAQKNMNIIYEYSLLETGPYQDFVNGKVENLPAGTVWVRIKAVSGVAAASQPRALTITQPNPTYTISLSTSSLGFGSELDGYSAPPPAQTVTITNQGSGAITGFSITGAGTAFDVSYTSGQIAANGGTATFTVRPGSGLAIGSYSDTLTVSTTPAQTNNPTVGLTFAVGAIPATIMPPEADGTVKVKVKEGGSATFRIAATGTGPFTYQWFRDSKDGSGFQPVSSAGGAGAAGPDFITSIAKLEHSGNRYYCIATNSVNSAKSCTFMLDVVEKEPPQTGDTAMPWLWAGLALLAGYGLIMMRKNGCNKTGVAR